MSVIPLITKPGAASINPDMVAAPRGLDTPSSWYTAMLRKWHTVNALLGGTEAMRRACQSDSTSTNSYLPQFLGETDAEYSNRVSRTWLIDLFRDSVEKAVSGPFSRPVSLIGQPLGYDKFFNNIDHQGNSLTRFSREVFFQSVAKGFSHIWIAFSEQTGPYWVDLGPEQVIAAYSEVVDGAEVLTQVRIRESFTRLDGFTEEAVEQIKVVEASPLGDRPATYTVYEKDGAGYVISRDVDGGLLKDVSLGLPYIPLVTNYSNRRGFMLSDPPLYPVAEKNIEHFQSSSEQKEALTCGRFQMVVLTGYDEEKVKQLKFGPRQVIASADPNAKAYWIEPTGAALTAGRADLDSIVADAQRSSNALYMTASSQEVATPSALEEGRRTSWLQDMVLGLQGSLNRSLDITAEYLKVPSLGSCRVNLDFTPTVSAVWKTDALLKAHQEGLDDQTYLQRLKDFGILADTDDPAVLAPLMKANRLAREAGVTMTGSIGTV